MIIDTDGCIGRTASRIRPPLRRPSSGVERRLPRRVSGRQRHRTTASDERPRRSSTDACEASRSISSARSTLQLRLQDRPERSALGLIAEDVPEIFARGSDKLHRRPTKRADGALAGACSSSPSAEQDRSRSSLKKRIEAPKQQAQGAVTALSNDARYGRRATPAVCFARDKKEGARSEEPRPRRSSDPGALSPGSPWRT